MLSASLLRVRSLVTFIPVHIFIQKRADGNKVHIWLGPSSLLPWPPHSQVHLDEKQVSGTSTCLSFPTSHSFSLSQGLQISLALHLGFAENVSLFLSITNLVSSLLITWEQTNQNNAQVTLILWLQINLICKL